MKITSLQIGRFGVWENMSLPKLSPGLNVFFGPNEAGKTTLMQFIRACLYGGADEDRARYIQMALDGRRRRGLHEVAEPAEQGSLPESGGADSAVDAARNPARSWIGGAATLATDFGEHRVERRYIKRDGSYLSAAERRSGFAAPDGLANWSGRFYALPGLRIAESLVITGPDGAPVGDYFAKTLTCNLDESTYNGVFAIGLDELQKLGALDETEASQMLYRLSVGVDRGSFVQVFHQIVAERNDLFDAKDRPSILTNLVDERARARQAASASSTELAEYSRLLEERRALEEGVTALQDRRDKATRQQRARELALRLVPLWDERRRRREEIAAMGEVPEVERSAIDECDRLTKESHETAARIKTQRDAYRAKRDERDAIDIEPGLAELAPRVSILEEDLPRLKEIDEKIGALRQQLSELNENLAEEERRIRSARSGKLVITQSSLEAINETLAAQQASEAARLGQVKAGEKPVKLPNKLVETGTLSKEIEDYTKPAKRVKRAMLRLRRYRADLSQAQGELNALVLKLEEGLTTHGQKNLTEAIERTGKLLSALRRRIEIDKRMDEMATYRRELERQNHALAETQAIVGVPLYALGAGVVVGSLLFGLSLFSSKVDLVAGLVGLLATIGCVFYKATVERRNRMKLEDNQRRLGLLLKQLEQARAEAASIDEKYPSPTGQGAVTLDLRLQRAKQELTFFEGLAPVEAQWRSATKKAKACEARVARGIEGVKKARKRWRKWLRSACLPDTLKPRQTRELFSRAEMADDVRAQIANVAAEIEYLGRERQGIMERFDAAVALVPQLRFAETSPFFVTPKLRELLVQRDEALKARDVALGEMNAIKRRCRKDIAIHRRQSRETRRYLRGFGARSREELVELVERYELLCSRITELDAADQRFVEGVGDFCEPRVIEELLGDQETRENLAASIAEIENRVASYDAELKSKLETSGRLSEQLDALAARKETRRARFDVAAYNLRLGRVAELWQSRAVAGMMMEEIRRAYEKERQPETLREASRFLKRLTDGMYVNIWTPLGEDTLFVDASNGETLEVASLSRGTRELLFIAIRLALVVSFEKHGVQTPLIWDDVLVNFDYRRAAIAAKVLVEFAKGGRQIFLFTCHEHICRLFLKLGVSVCVLPTSTDPEKRRFRVLSPLKKRLARGEAELRVDVRRPVEMGPNFVERGAVETEGDDFAVPGSDFEDAENVGAAISQEKDVLERPEYDFAPQQTDESSVISAESDVDVRVEQEIASDAVAASPALGAEAQSSTVDVEKTVNASFTVAEDADAHYTQTQREVTLGNESANLRALSEISPTFTTQSSDSGDFEVNDRGFGARQDAPRRPSNLRDDNVDYVTIDEEYEGADAPDYDAWTSVFGDGGDSSRFYNDDKSEQKENFNDYFTVDDEESDDDQNDWDAEIDKEDDSESRDEK